MDGQRLPKGHSAVVHSDILIKALIEEDLEAKKRLGSFLVNMNPKNEELFVINEFILSDVLSAKAKKATVSQLEIVQTLVPPYSSYYDLIQGGYDISKPAIEMLQVFPDYNMTFTDWATLCFMDVIGERYLISDKEELDDVIHGFKFSNITRI
jgi:hypothetical protein